jgi:hypothetical protein
METLTTKQERELTFRQAKEFLEERRGIKASPVVLNKFVAVLYDLELWLAHEKIAQ